VKEVVRQPGCATWAGSAIDFIDMANPKNRATVEALRTEFERDETKTYVVEIPPPAVG
jgi:Ribonuclease G/E